MTPIPRRLPLLALASLAAPAAAHPDVEAFAPTAFIEAPAVVDCTLETGAAARCYEFTVGYKPQALEIGPFCPATLDDAGGIWEWTARTPGSIASTAPSSRCWTRSATGSLTTTARSTSPTSRRRSPRTITPASTSRADESVEITMRLPVDPVMADAPRRSGPWARSAWRSTACRSSRTRPAIQQTGHMPALDTCGGHIDPGGWYHWHATSTDIETVFRATGVVADCALDQDAGAQFGYAFDGFAL